MSDLHNPRGASVSVRVERLPGESNADLMARIEHMRRALKGETVTKRLGRLPSDPHAPKLRLKHFLDAPYTGTVPDVVDYLTGVGTWPMYRNDDLGDCTAAAAGHILEAVTHYGQGTTIAVSDSDVTKFYSGSTGYKPSDPSSDQGGDMLTVLKYWAKTGLAGHKIAAYFAVDPSDFDEMRAALYLFGNLYIGLELPANAETAFDHGQAWDVVKGAKNLGGHCVNVQKIVKGGNLTVVTWGGTVEMTPAFWNKYVDEPYAVVSQEWVKNGATPEGLDTAGANAAFQQLTGKPGPFTVAPAPTPAPSPVPAPQPVPAPSKDVDLLRALRVSIDALSAKLRAGGY